MVIDELIVRDGITNFPIDSYDGEMIEEIVYEGETFHFAKQKDLTGTSEVVAENGVAEPIRSLSVSGATSQSGTPTPEAPIPIENANANGMSVVLHGNNLFDLDEMLKLSNFTIATYDGQECIKVANGGTFNIPFEIPANTKFSISYERAFPKADYYWFFKFDDGTYTSSGFTSGYYPNTSQEQFTKVTKSNLSYTKNIVAIQMRLYGSINEGYYPMYFRNIMANLGTTALPYEPYFRQEISIPSSVNVDGTTVPLLFSKWDKLTVDRIANKVIYTEGGWQRAMTGTEKWYNGWWSENNGYGKQYCLATGRDYKVTPTIHTGYSNCFVKKRWANEATQNSFIVSDEATSDTDKGIIQVYTDKVSPIEDFKAMLSEKYAEGNPVVFLVKRTAANTKQHDLTNTDLGQSLLALATGKGTNYLEITSDLAPSQTDLSYWEQIIPNHETT